jgi:hypothetical protein
MKKPVPLILAALLIGLGIWGWRACFPSPENAIRSRLHDLARTVSFEPGEGAIPRGLKARSVGEYFTPDVAISLDVRGFEAHELQGRDELMPAVMGATQRLSGLKVEFLDINVTLDAGKQKAEVNLTGKATTAGEPEFQVQEFNFKLKRVDRTWLIYRIDTVRTLSRATTFVCPPSEQG